MITDGHARSLIWILKMYIRASKKYPEPTIDEHMANGGYSKRW